MLRPGADPAAGQSAAANGRQWARLAPLLAGRFHVVCMDRRGWGASGSTAPATRWTPNGATLSPRPARCPGRVHLMGHLSGARFALLAATRLPDLAGLVLYEPPAPEPLTDDAGGRLRPAGGGAIASLCSDLNSTETVYPGTDLVVRYSVKEP